MIMDPPFSRENGEHEVVLAISNQAVLAGYLPARALGLVQEWAQLHRFELELNWRKARDGHPLDTIEPLS